MLRQWIEFASDFGFAVSKMLYGFSISILSSHKNQPPGRRLLKGIDEIRTYFLYSY
ncbi:MAG: hypothetical protein JRI92_01185 [Deltaproteobacteria bacterium]|nr:hypothetical protein [Deltaproteobacteria bacterium]